MSTIYVDAAWASKTNGDKVTVNGTEYTIGVDAFATSKAAYMAARDMGGEVTIDLTNAGTETLDGTIGFGNANKDGVYTITGGNGRNTTSYGISTANTNITVKFEDAAFKIGKAYFANSGSALFVDNSVIGTAYYSGHNSGWFTAGNGNISISDSIFGINYANFTDEEIAGIVDSVIGTNATVLISDDGPEYDEAVTVYNSEGKQIGTGNLYIHSALRVTGYAGTIDSVEVDVNEKVSDTTKLFTLEDTSYSANYNALLRERAKLEEKLLELLVL